MSEQPSPELDPYASPTAAEPPAQAVAVNAPPQLNGADSTGGLIPYNNPAALLSYYLGIVSLFPLLGFPFGIAAIVLARKGFQKRRQFPAVRGHVHAWIGLILALLGMPIHLLIGSGVAIGIASAFFDA